MNKKMYLIPSVLVLFILFLIASFVVIKPTQADHKAQSPGANPYSNLINGFQDQLTDPDLSAASRNKIQERIDLLNKLTTEEAVGYKNPAPRDPSFTPTEGTIEGYVIPDGIEDNPSPPYKHLDLVISNAWRKTVEKKRFLIYAGRLVLDPNQGAVMLFQNERNQFVIYRTPKVAGEVKIIAEEKLILELQSKDGMVFYFDVLQEAYLVDGELIKIDPGIGEKPIENPYPAP